jgi:hypothetical protein
MYHIYMPVEMVLLMTKNRHFINKGLVAKPATSMHKNKQHNQCKYDNEYDYNQNSNIIELYKYS